MLLPFARPLAILLSLAILGAGAWSLSQWHQGQLLIGPDGAMTTAPGSLWQLLLALALLGVSAGGGRQLYLLFLPSRGRYRAERSGQSRQVAAPDGTRLEIEASGPADAPVIVLTHGWGLSARAWAPIRERLSASFRVIAWDLPGLGRSGEPPDGIYLLDRFAAALGAVVESTGAARVVVVGHSIGGMTSETFWRACPAHIKARVAGVVLVHTTHTNPLRTMWLSDLWLALQTPVIEPLQRLTILLSPVIWLANWQSYLSGSLHVATRLASFGRHAPREAVELAARLSAEAKPSVQAKGNLAMINWHVTEDLSEVAAPTLVIGGTADIITESRASAEIAGHVPRARLRQVDGVGHLGYLEQEQLYAEAIADFAGEALGPTAAATSQPTA